MTDVHNDEMADEDFDTVLSPDIDFSGVINFEKSFLVRGRIQGEINARGLLLIDKDSNVKADIQADRVIIRGEVAGNVKAEESVEITSSGKLSGNVNTPEINFESGCLFNGKCTMKAK